MGFRLVVPKSVTLNDVQWRNIPYFALFHQIRIDKEANYIAVVEDRPIRFGVEYPLPVLSWPELNHAAVAWSLCSS